MLAAVAGSSAAARAHHATAEDVIARIGGAETRAAFDVTQVERAADLPRLLLVRVGPGWRNAAPERRLEAAQQWHALWRDAVPNGVVAVVDAAERPLVNFDSHGRARLRDAPHPPAAATPR